MTIYTHIHHIIPRHMGGTDDADNLVEVTVEQHALLHKQLWEDLGNIKDYYAWMALSGRVEDKIRHRCSLGGKIGGKKLKNKPKSEEHKRKLSLSTKGQKHSQESIDRMKEALTGSKSVCSKQYKVIDPNGNEYIIKGLNNFCRKNNLSQSVMCNVAKGNRKQHKGWKCIDVSV